MNIELEDYLEVKVEAMGLNLARRPGKQQAPNLNKTNPPTPTMRLFGCACKNDQHGGGQEEWRTYQPSRDGSMPCHPP